MIELNKIYSMKELAEAINITYGTFRNNRKEYEEHLAKFYQYNIIHEGNNIYYTFISELYSYVPYKKYKAMQKSSTLQKHIKDTIYHDNRQTGSNIARIIIVNGEIQALNLMQSTLTVYVRDELKELVKRGYYKKEDYQWCYLDKEKKCYVLMSEKEIQRLRSFFHTRESDEAEENIWAKQEEGDYTINEANEAVGELRKGMFFQGREYFYKETGKWPIKVPVYTRNALVGD